LQAVVKVSVLMTVYEAADYLEAAVQSVIGQTFLDWDLLVMDDGSPDPRIMEYLSSIDDERVTIVHFDTTSAEREQSVRYATLLNWGAEVTQGDYLTFLCGDDFYYSHRLGTMVDKIEEGHDVVYGSQRLLRENGDWFHVRTATQVLTSAYHQVDLNSVMVTRRAFDKVGGFPAEPSPTAWREADALFWNRLTDAGYLFVPVALQEGCTDAKRYRNESVDARVIRGETPW
jgi:glycosyltransferase involved in cell wall biosynthesis